VATALNVQAWSTNPASNSGADSTIGTIDNDQAATKVDDWQRGNMAAIAKYIDDVGGALVAGGTADALTVTTNQVLSQSHVTDGLMLAVRATAANTSTTVTFAPDSLTAAPIKCADGTAPAVGQIADGTMLLLFYNATAGEWRAANLGAVVATSSQGSATASFLAHKNGSDQSVSTTAATKVTFGTEVFDVGSKFASSTWTPPSGTVLIHASVTIDTAITTASTFELKLYKNASFYKSVGYEANFTYSPFSLVLSIIDTAGGSDTYEIYIDSGTNSSYTVEGDSTDTWFCGTMV